MILRLVYHSVRGLYFLAAIFAATIHSTSAHPKVANPIHVVLSISLSKALVFEPKVVFKVYGLKYGYDNGL